MNHHARPRTMSSREFNQHTGRAKQAADEGPLMITDRGQPAYVLMRFEEYERLEQQAEAAERQGAGFVSLLDAVADKRPEADFDYDFPRAEWSERVVDLGDE